MLNFILSSQPQVTEETCQILQAFGYTFEQRGLVAVKGKGQLMTYYLQVSELSGLYFFVKCTCIGNILFLQIISGNYFEIYISSYFFSFISFNVKR